MDKQSLEQTKLACARGQKRGLHFILASVVIWTLVFIVHLTTLPIETKNLTAAISVGALLVGLLFPPHILALCMVVVEIIFCLLLIAENKKL